MNAFAVVAIDVDEERPCLMAFHGHHMGADLSEKGPYLVAVISSTLLTACSMLCWVSGERSEPKPKRSAGIVRSQAGGA